MPHAVQYHTYIVYDGTNSAAVLAFCQMDPSTAVWSIESETGGVLTLKQVYDAPAFYELGVGDLVVTIGAPGQAGPNPMGANAFADFYKPLPPAALSLGTATTPNIGANAQATVTVTLAPAQSSATYLAASALAGSSQLLGALSILSTTIVDADTVDVVVKNTGLLALAGATVVVSAVS